MRAWLARLAGTWVVRSLFFGGVSATCDWSLVYLTGERLGVPSALAAATGLSVGATVNFLLNRRFAFPDTRARLAGAAVRYAAAFGCLLALHATLVGILADRVGLHLLLSKLIADVSLLLGGQLLILRYVVFPRARAAPGAVAAERATGSTWAR